MSAEIGSAVIGDGAAQGSAVPRSESVKSAYRTLQLLELLADTPGRLSLADLQRRLGVPSQPPRPAADPGGLRLGGRA